MRRRIIYTLILLASFNGYAAFTLISRWPLAAHHIIYSCLLAAAFFILQITAPFADRLFFPKLKKKFQAKWLFRAIDVISYTALGTFSCLFIYCTVMNIAEIFWMMITRSYQLDIFNHYALLVLGGATFVTIAIGIFQAVSRPVIRHVSVPLDNLPEAFNGFKIVQISDLHLGPTIKRAYAQRVVTIANNLKPDLIALTGDFVDGTVEELRNDIAPLKDLEAPDGVFFITGNHEYYWGASDWCNEITRLGIHVLRNEHVLLERNDQKIVLAGVADYSTVHTNMTDKFNPKQAIAGAPPNSVKILLAHQPASYKQALEAGFDLQISGHTHGGQYFPFSLFIRFFQRYYKGLNRIQNMWLYVSCGTGYWGPPLRTAVPPEITVITLQAVKKNGV